MITIFLQPNNIMVFHQLRGTEVSNLWRALEMYTVWTANLIGTGLSAGVIIEVATGGRGSATAIRRGVTPFILL